MTCGAEPVAILPSLGIRGRRRCDRAGGSNVPMGVVEVADKISDTCYD